MVITTFTANNQFPAALPRFIVSSRPNQVEMLELEENDDLHGHYNSQHLLDIYFIL